MKNQSVYDYFYEHYGIRLTYWQLPLVQTETSGMFPMELCCIAPNQRYPYKLDPNQVNFLHPSIWKLANNTRLHL